MQAAAKHLGTDESTPLGVLLSGGVPRELVANRVRVLMFVFVRSNISDNTVIDNLSVAFQRLATSPNPEDSERNFRSKDWFKAGMLALQTKKLLLAKEASGLLGELVCIDKVVMRVLEDIEAGRVDYLPGSDFDVVAPLASLIAHSILPERSEEQVAGYMHETFSRLVNQHHGLAKYPEISVVLDMLRFRNCPGGEEGTVQRLGDKTFVQWTKSNTPAKSRRALVTKDSETSGIGIGMTPQPA